MDIKIKFTLVLIFFSHLVYPQDLQFCKEKICIDVKNKECILTGLYYFVNNSQEKIKQNLYYPFVVKDDLPLPYKVEVKLLNNNALLPTIKTAKGIIFPVEVKSKDTVKVEVVYYQKTPSNKMEYILTTTQKWGKPFAEAEYIVKIPSEYKLIEMQPQFENISSGQNQKIYSVIKKNYLPDHNFIISWEENNERVEK